MTDLNALLANAKEKIGTTTKSDDFSPIPEGEYLTEITRCGMVDKDWGKKAEFEFTILEGEYKTRKLWTNFSLDGQYAQKGVEFLMKSLMRLGVSAMANDHESLGQVLDSLVGSEVVVFTKVKTYQNKNGENKQINNAYVQYVPTDEEKSFGKSEGDSDVPF